MNRKSVCPCKLYFAHTMKRKGVRTDRLHALAQSETALKTRRA